MPRVARKPIELYKLIKKERVSFNELWKAAKSRKIGHDKFYELLEELEYAGCVVVRKEGRNKEIIKIVSEIDGWKWNPDDLRRIAVKELMKKIKTNNELRGFLEEGLSLSPTAIKHFAVGVPEVRVGVAMLLSARKYYLGEDLDEIAEYIAALWISLIIDSLKYPKLREKIEEFNKKHEKFFLEFFGQAFKSLHEECNL